VLTFCATVSTSLSFPPKILRKLVAESGIYARSGAPLGTWISLREQQLYIRYDCQGYLAFCFTLGICTWGFS
jgi:hypothetical protein